MIRIAASARRDLDEGYDFYESQQIGLGDYFLSSVKADIESLKFTAGIHRIAYADISACCAKRSHSRFITPNRTRRSQYLR